jgi:hypothetical protein
MLRNIDNITFEIKREIFNFLKNEKLLIVAKNDSDWFQFQSNNQKFLTKDNKDEWSDGICLR